MHQDRRIFIKSFLVQQGLYLAFLFVLCWSLNIVHVQSEDGHSPARTKFCFDRKYKGHRLNSRVIKNVSSLSAVDCVVYCVSEPCCRSTNYRKVDSLIDGNENCELLQALALKQTEALKKDDRYDYYILLQPIKPILTGGKCHQEPKSCDNLTKNKPDGIYTIDPDGLGAFDVRCDMTTDGGGWTVFQRRMDGSVDFSLNWTDYKNGFGNLSGEFWLGLDKINRLSKSGLNALRIDIKDFENGTSYVAKYNIFSVSNGTDFYKLTVGNCTGNITDWLSYHNGMHFSTPDADHDMKTDDGNCASDYKTGWWYKHCYDAHLNGLYGSRPINHSDPALIRWGAGKEGIILNSTEMKIRPRN